jgi:hypothetical protein
MLTPGKEFWVAWCFILAILVVCLWLFPQPEHFLFPISAEFAALILRVLVGFIVAVVIIGSIQAYRLAKQRKDESSKEQEWNAKRRNQKLDAAANFEPIVSEERANRESQKRDSERRYFGEAITFLALLAAAGVAILQWHTLEKTDDTLRVQRRAWIAPDRIVPPQNFIDEIEEDAAIGLSFRNVGKEPALKTTETVLVDIIQVDDWQNIAKAKVKELLGKKCDEFNPTPDGRTIFPDLPRSRLVDLNAEKAIKASKHKTHFVIVVGCFSYETLNEIHRSQFCGVLAPPNRSNDNKWQTVLCEVHNGAD